MSLLTVAQTLAAAAARIGGDSPALDAGLLLSRALGKPRTWLYTWPEALVDAASSKVFWQWVAARTQGQPVAYLLGDWDFWTLTLQVSPATLIPRADTECLVERALALPLPQRARLLDLGTGTGALALALASERPDWQVQAVDLQQDAVALAQANAQRLGLQQVQIQQSDWFAALQKQVQSFDLIVSNPPYIDEDDPHLQTGDLRFEPCSALVAADHGLADLQRIIEQAPHWLAAGGWLLVEHGWQQGDAVAALFAKCGYQAIATRLDHAGNSRMTEGCLKEGRLKEEHRPWLSLT